MTTSRTDRKYRWWPWLRRLLTLAFFAALLWLLIAQGRAINWADVVRVLRELPASAIAIGLAATALSYGLFAGYELLSAQMTGLKLPRRRVAQIAFVSYAFNLNLGAWVGGIGFRYRLYSRFGAPTALITRVLGASLLTNWIGYVAVGGVIFSLAVVDVPPQWKFGTGSLRIVGGLLLLMLASYLGLAAFATRRSLTLRGHRFELPRLRIALLQVLLASANWLTIAFVIHTMLRGAVPYPDVLAVFLLASIAGVATHIPAGLGVLEAVFIGLLGQQLPGAELLGALLAYRAVFYLGPLLLALLLYFGLEARARQVQVAGGS